ncbi:MAG: cation-translocating P-type ATPase [Sandaracinaceae bacterium]|nr:cation-translocating P-type ATPase [Sandaracinaceae bacterium]
MAPTAEGLSSVLAAERLVEVGPNALHREEATPVWRLFARQFGGALVWVLLAACAVSAALGEVLNAAAIGAVVVLNALIGFFQEHRSERAMLALRAMTAPRARVRRDGRDAIVPAEHVVPGDLLVLEAGDVVAADADLIEAHALSANEASLTGESLPVDKSIEPVAAAAPLAERTDRVFMGTAIAGGTGRAVVRSTGMRTELGRIAGLLASAQSDRTPLERRLEQVSRWLLVLCIAIASLVAIVGFLQGQGWLAVLMSAVSLAIAAVPEGLAAIVTIALAVGVQRMAARNVLVRKLPAVETLGSATIICTDKTGTLTTGVMAARELWGPDHARVLELAALCSDAELDASGIGGTGDPTELAILAAAYARGIERSPLEREKPRVAVSPFDSRRKRMSILRADGRLYVKGAPETTLPLCTGGTEGALAACEEMAARGLRVLAVAVGTEAAERSLELAGLIGLADPPRSEAIDAVRLAREAGIRTVMITGDHPLTAEAIAREIGIVRPGEAGTHLIHARATPEDKLRIVREWKARGEVVAMTGDGVNDAPALREADIGVAMGKTGTEVAREASAMILADDNYASIVAAIREGRGIFRNLRNVLVYLLSGNLGELIIVLGALVMGLPLPLTPLQILWVNLVTESPPSIALVSDVAGPEVLRGPPRPPRAPLLDRIDVWTIALTAFLQAAVTLAVFAWAVEARGLETARNLAFSVLVFGDVLRALAARSRTRTFWETGALTNLRLVAVVALTILVQLALHHVPFTQELFGIGTISLADCGLTLALGFIPVTVLEISKLLMRLGRGRAGLTRRVESASS